MRILYLVRQVTRDEVAIYSALVELGYNVSLSTEMVTSLGCFDFALLHINWVPINLRLPFVVWCFDPMLGADHYLSPLGPSLPLNRKRWLKEVLPLSLVSFFTDGQVVEEFPEKAVRLMQGAPDDIAMGGYVPNRQDILFPGNMGGARAGLVETVKNRFPGITRVVQGKTGLELYQEIAGARIVVAPDTPIKPNYWSNRVYLISGYGGFLLHPYIEELAQQYTDGEEVVFYTSREDLIEKVEYYLDPSNDQERRCIANNALARTRAEHTYTHRVKQLMGVVEERLLTTNRSEP